MTTIYCSVCADTARYTGETCWHCGAISETAYKHTGYRFAALVLVVAIVVGTAWAFAVTKTAKEAVISPSDEMALHVPEKLGEADISATYGNAAWVLVRAD
jgi:hypothetical protein